MQVQSVSFYNVDTVKMQNMQCEKLHTADFWNGYGILASEKKSVILLNDKLKS